MDNKIKQVFEAINEIISCQNKIVTIPVAEEFCSSIHQSIINLPGVLKCRICLSYVSKPFGDEISENCKDCICYKSGEDKLTWICLLKDELDILIVPVATNFNGYGNIILKTAPDFFPELTTALNGFANTIALKIESSLQKEALEIRNREFAETQKSIEELTKKQNYKTDHSEDKLIWKKEVSIAGSKLNLNEIKHLEAIENMIEGCQIIGFDWKYLYLNNSAEKHSRRPRTELLGKRYMDVWPGAEETTIFSFMSQCMNQRTSNFLQNEFIFPDGSTGWFDLSIQPVYEGIFILSMDITNRKIAENALIDSEERFKKAFVTSPDSININRMEDGLYVNINKGFTEIMGYTEEEIIGKTSLEKEIWVDQEDRKKLLERLKQNGFVNNLEALFRKKDGSIVTGLMSATCIDLAGVPHILSMTRDIGDLKKIREALQESEKRLSLYIEYSPVFTYIKEVTSTESRVLNASRNFIEITGVCQEEMIGKTMDQLYPPEFATKITADDWNVITTGKIVQLEEEFNGRYYNTIKFPISQGRKSLLAGYTIDITEKKNYESELIHAKDKAEESDRLKTAFLANMSHEIRTPMNGILGFASLLKEPNLTGEDQQAYIDLIEKSGARMLNIINDLITISKVESGLMELTHSKTNINEQLDFLFNFFKVEANLKNLHLEFHCPLPNNQATIFTDREKLFSILTNLIKNAIKFTNTGIVNFGYNLKGDLIEFYVSDTGIGISQEKHKGIFDRFVQADTSLSRGYEGAGLGLSISKAYVEMLGGKIWVDSKVGVGSKFFFTINPGTNPPIELQPDILFQEVAEIKSNNKTILIAEDDEDSRNFMTIVLKTLGCKILVANTGKEAVDCCRANSDINLVLMDIKMPVMDGHTAAKLIKEFRPNLPIIAQTAYALETEKKKYGDIFNTYLTKPIQASDLKQKISRYIKF